MINIVIGFFTFIEILVALLIILLVMVQKSKSSGLGGLAGGLGEDSFGAGAANVAKRATVICACIFLVNTVGLILLEGKAHDEREDSAVDRLLIDEAEAGDETTSGSAGSSGPTASGGPEGATGMTVEPFDPDEAGDSPAGGAPTPEPAE